MSSLDHVPLVLFLFARVLGNGRTIGAAWVLESVLGMVLVQIDLQRRLESEKKRQREIVMQKSKEIMSLKRSAMK